MRYYIKYLEIAVILAILVGLGIVRFARLSPSQAREVEVRAGLEQLYQLEADHYTRRRAYFNPDDPRFRTYLPWLDVYAHEVQWDGRSFAVVVHADLDNDGQRGAWRVGSEGPDVTVLVED